jgi:cytochrome c5
MAGTESPKKKAATSASQEKKKATAAAAAGGTGADIRNFVCNPSSADSWAQSTDFVVLTGIEWGMLFAYNIVPD